MRTHDLNVSKVTGDVTRLSFPEKKNPVRGFYVQDDDAVEKVTPTKQTSPRRSSLPVHPASEKLLRSVFIRESDNF